MVAVNYHDIGKQQYILLNTQHTAMITNVFTVPSWELLNRKLNDEKCITGLDPVQQYYLFFKLWKIEEYISKDKWLECPYSRQETITITLIKKGDKGELKMLKGKIGSFMISQYTPGVIVSGGEYAYFELGDELCCLEKLLNLLNSNPSLEEEFTFLFPKKITSFTKWSQLSEWIDLKSKWGIKE
jgi:hypothetical protein